MGSIYTSYTQYKRIKSQVNALDICTIKQPQAPHSYNRYIIQFISISVTNSNSAQLKTNFSALKNFSCETSKKILD